MQQLIDENYEDLVDADAADKMIESIAQRVQTQKLLSSCRGSTQEGSHSLVSPLL